MWHRDYSSVGDILFDGLVPTWMTSDRNQDSFNEIWMVSQGAVSIRKTVLPDMVIPMLKIRRPDGRLIFNMEIAIRR